MIHIIITTKLLYIIITVREMSKLPRNEHHIKWIWKRTKNTAEMQNMWSWQAEKDSFLLHVCVCGRTIFGKYILKLAKWFNCVSWKVAHTTSKKWPGTVADFYQADCMLPTLKNRDSVSDSYIDNGNSHRTKYTGDTVKNEKEANRKLLLVTCLHNQNNWPAQRRPFR